jgi:hypothetical protein
VNATGLVLPFALGRNLFARLLLNRN